MLIEFVNQVRSRARSVGGTVGKWSGAHRRSPSMLEVRSRALRRTLLYVKYRSEAPGFWGLTDNQLRALGASGAPWFVVLLAGPGERAYALSGAEVLRHADRGAWTLTSGDYKLNERQDVGAFHKFESHADLIDHVLTPVLAAV